MKSINHVAIIVAAIVFFAIGAVWYNVFSEPWLAGIGKTVDQLMPRRTADRRSPSSSASSRSSSCATRSAGSCSAA